MLKISLETIDGVDQVTGEVIPEIVEANVAQKLLEFQKRCVSCGSTLYLQIHHRIHRSEAENGLRDFLMKIKPIYESSYGKTFLFWYLHSIQNLVVLCRKCHEGDGVGVHGGNTKLRDLLRYSFTCPVTGFNVSFYKPKPTFTF